MHILAFLCKNDTTMQKETILYKIKEQRLLIEGVGDRQMWDTSWGENLVTVYFWYFVV